MEHACAGGGGGGAGTSAGDLDRLSALPDCLLHEIMSSLKARQAVQTCVLSTRWRNLWRSAPCLDVDLDEFSNSNINRWEDWLDFEVFTVNLMFRCNMALLDSFRLRVTRGREAPPANYRNQMQAWGWLSRAMKHSSSSWHLKRLHLCSVFLDNSFVNHVGSGCHLLEDLELDACTSYEIRKIDSHSIKNLVLKRCNWSRFNEIKTPTLKTLVIHGDTDAFHLTLDIMAPALARLHLDLKYNSIGGISLNKMTSLVKASINLQCGSCTVFKCRLLGDQLNILRSVSNVTSLEWSGAETKVLGDKEPMFQEFKNLRNLLLGNCVVGHNTLGFFLHSSPKLEKLTLEHCTVSDFSKETKGTPKLNTSSSSECHGFDFRCENIKFCCPY